MPDVTPYVQGSEATIGHEATVATEVGDIILFGVEPWVWNSAHSAAEIAAGQNVRGSVLPRGGIYKTTIDVGGPVARGERAKASMATSGGAYQEMLTGSADAGRTHYDFGIIVSATPSATVQTAYDCLIFHDPDGSAADVGS